MVLFLFHCYGSLMFKIFNFVIRIHQLTLYFTPGRPRKYPAYTENGLEASITCSNTESINATIDAVLAMTTSSTLTDNNGAVADVNNSSDFREDNPKAEQDYNNTDTNLLNTSEPSFLIRRSTRVKKVRKFENAADEMDFSDCDRGDYGYCNDDSEDQEYMENDDVDFPRKKKRGKNIDNYSFIKSESTSKDDNSTQDQSRAQMEINNSVDT